MMKYFKPLCILILFFTFNSVQSIAPSGGFDDIDTDFYRLDHDADHEKIDDSDDAFKHVWSEIF